MMLENVGEIDSITRIYACVTIWHETEEELLDLLESILQMDEDQCSKRETRRRSYILEPNYYELESKNFCSKYFFFYNGFDRGEDLKIRVKYSKPTTNATVPQNKMLDMEFYGQAWRTSKKSILFVHLLPFLHNFYSPPLSHC